MRIKTLDVENISYLQKVQFFFLNLNVCYNVGTKLPNTVMITQYYIMHSACVLSMGRTREIRPFEF